MAGLSSVIGRRNEKGLLLVDELSRGTNPQEGYALSRSITDFLDEGVAISVFTSHFDGITEGKVHYQVRGLRDVDLQCLREGSKALASLHQQMDYTLERVDGLRRVPREAIPIASILGLDERFIERARKYLIHDKEEQDK